MNMKLALYATFNINCLPSCNSFKKTRNAETNQPLQEQMNMSWKMRVRIEIEWKHEEIEENVF